MPSLQKLPLVNVEQYLQDHGIVFRLHEHPAVFTCAEAAEHCRAVPGLSCKSLLLRDNKSRRYFLIVLPAANKADLKKISELVSEKNNLTFARPEELLKLLGVEPGAVSPFGLLNDVEHIVEGLVDKAVYEADIVSFHPNRNTASLELTSAMFHKYLQSLEHKITICDL